MSDLEKLDQIKAKAEAIWEWWNAPAFGWPEEVDTLSAVDTPNIVTALREILKACDSAEAPQVKFGDYTPSARINPSVRTSVLRAIITNALSTSCCATEERPF